MPSMPMRDIRFFFQPIHAAPVDRDAPRSITPMTTSEEAAAGGAAAAVDDDAPPRRRHLQRNAKDQTLARRLSAAPDDGPVVDHASVRPPPTSRKRPAAEEPCPPILRACRMNWSAILMRSLPGHAGKTKGFKFTRSLQYTTGPEYIIQNLVLESTTIINTPIGVVTAGAGTRSWSQW